MPNILRHCYISFMKILTDRSFIVVIILSILVKVIYLIWGNQGANQIAALSIDELYHYKWAAAIGQGDLLTNAPYFRAPFYSFFLALLLKISWESLVFTQIIQLALGCLTIGLIYKIGYKITNKFAAVCASLIYLAYPLSTYFEGELLLDSLFILLSILSYYFYLKSNDANSSILTGLFFGLAAITRPTMLVFLPIIIFGYLRRAHKEKIKRLNLKPLFAFIILCVITIAPVTLVNYFTSGQFIPISYQGGINFYIGNNPEADGVSAVLPPFGREWTLDDADYTARVETGREIKYSEQSVYWFGKGFDYLISQPMKFAKLYSQKVLLFFSGREISNNIPLSMTVYNNKVLSIFPMQLIFILGLAIIPLFFKKSRQIMKPLYILILIYGLAISFFFISSRFRMPVVPILCIVGGFGISFVYDNLRNGKLIQRSITSIVASVALILILSNLTFATVKLGNQQALYIRGNQLMRAGDYNGARLKFDSLVIINPMFENGHVNLGITYLKTGNTREAMRYFDLELVYNPKSPEGANNLAAMYLINGIYDSALYYAASALEEKPYYREAAINLLRAAISINNDSASHNAEETRKAVRQYLFDDPYYIFEEALYLSNLGRISEAINNHFHAIELIDDHPREISFRQIIDDDNSANMRVKKLANYQLGYLYGITGEFDKSIIFSSHAIETDPEFKEAYVNLISGYRSLGKEREADSLAEIYIRKWPNN